MRYLIAGVGVLLGSLAFAPCVGKEGESKAPPGRGIARDAAEATTETAWPEIPEVGWGGGAKASTKLLRETTPNGIRIEIPLWVVTSGDLESVSALVAEIDLSIEAFSKAWGEPVRPSLVRIYPYGNGSFPFDGCDTMLAAGATWKNGAVMLALYNHTLPRLPALGHELVHVADPTLSHERFGEDRPAKAMAAARKAALAVYGE